MGARGCGHKEGSSKEPYNSEKETYISAIELYDPQRALCLCERELCFTGASEVVATRKLLQKSPMIPQKRQIFRQKG